MKKILFLFFIFFVLAGTAQAGNVTLAWDAVVDPDLAGYRVYRSGTSMGYNKATDKVCDVAKTTLTCTVQNLPDGTHFFVATAYDTAGNESVYSNEVSTTLDSTPPAAPRNLRKVNSGGGQDVAK